MRRSCWFNPSCVLVILLTLHVLIGMRPDVLFNLEIDGVRVATAESDSLGLVAFSFELPPDLGTGPHTATVNAAGTPEFEIEAGECEIVPRETEGGTE